MKETLCPVCGYDLGVEAWKGSSPSYEICPSCGTEFGYQDFRKDPADRADRQRQLREKWIAAGMKWYSTVRKKPDNWNPEKQLSALMEN